MNTNSNFLQAKQHYDKALELYRQAGNSSEYIEDIKVNLRTLSTSMEILNKMNEIKEKLSTIQIDEIKHSENKDQVNEIVSLYTDYISLGREINYLVEKDMMDTVIEILDEQIKRNEERSKEQGSDIELDGSPSVPIKNTDEELIELKKKKCSILFDYIYLLYDHYCHNENKEQLNYASELCTVIISMLKS